MVRYALLLVLAGATQVHAERWTDTTGKYSVEAEFLSVDDDVVSLKRGDGMVVKVPIAKLSFASKLRIKQLTKPKSEPASKAIVSPPAEPVKVNPNQDLIDQVTVSVNEVRTRERKLYKANKVVDKIEKTLEFDLELAGQPALDAREYGFLKIDTATGDGKPIERKVAPVFDIAKTYRQAGKIGSRKTDSGLSVELKYFDLDQTPKTVSLAGSIKLKTGGTKKSLTFTNLKPGPLQTPETEAAGINVMLRIRDGKKIKAICKEESKGFLESLALTDASGNKLKTSSSGRDSNDGGRTQNYHYELREQLPSHAKITLQIRLNPVEITIPFKIDKAPVQQKK